MEHHLFFLSLVTLFGTLSTLHVPKLDDLSDHDYLHKEVPSYFSKSCCNYNEPNAEDEMNIFIDCRGIINDKYKLQRPKPTGQDEEDRITMISWIWNRSTCFSYCFLHKQGMANEDGTINVETAMKKQKKSIPELVNPEAWTNIEKLCTKPNDDDKETYVCKKDALHFSGCVHDISEFYCPDALQSKGESCVKYREDTKKKYGI
ncbi:hypothetical protein C0J52_04642 [Blattella germanica]|nr:hypothetical protein C0J52_04642 [Blattella germanica]